ncbi:MAG: tryptophan--tRNA ligase [Rhodobacteraceae bacterium]|nr:tryptophan--tRNA ligase [Paracoccaceae bacterium]
MLNTISSQRIFSGIQPSGKLTIANYLGALKPFVELQQSGAECIYCIVDLHAITVWQDPTELKHSTRLAAACFIASGIDVNKSILFNQSQVSAHAELAWIFNCVSRLGWLGRMTQFKEKAGSNRENSSVGLFVYPALMAADILAYHATHVPVGEDQKQHLELTRDIAIKFNNDFGVDFFPVIEPIIEGVATRIMSLRDGTKKMSKSDPSDLSRINLTDDKDTIVKKIRRAKTDSYPIPSHEAEISNRPEAKNLINLYAALSDTTRDSVMQQFGGKGFSEFKDQLAELAIECVSPVTHEVNRLMDDNTELDRILATGADKAAIIARPIVKKTYEIVGLLSQ